MNCMQYSQVSVKKRGYLRARDNSHFVFLLCNHTHFRAYHTDVLRLPCYAAKLFFFFSFPIHTIYIQNLV